MTAMMRPPSLEALKAKAPEVAEFLRQLANPNRLLLLCHIAQAERSVTEIQAELGLKQPALSQQLAELRQAGLVQTRRESRSIYYSIKDARAQAIMDTLYAVFCGEGVPRDARSPRPATRPAGDAAQFARIDPAPSTRKETEP
jgi:DNA-binding transcriptional ArsR family regulator